MGRECDEDRSGRGADAISDFRAFLSSYRQAVFFQAQDMGEKAAPHMAAAREEGRYVLARLLGREVSEAEAESLIWFAGAAQEQPAKDQTNE